MSPMNYLTKLVAIVCMSFSIVSCSQGEKVATGVLAGAIIAGLLEVLSMTTANIDPDDVADINVVDSNVADIVESFVDTVVVFPIATVVKIDAIAII